MEKLTFKEYIESKQQLIEAIESCPERTAVYNIRKYCKLPIGEGKEDNQQLTLKPKQKLIVKWKYFSKTPDVTSIQVTDPKNPISEDTVSTFWKSERLIKWLSRNTSEETNK